MDDLVTRFDAVFSALWDDYERPTTASLSLIETRYEFTLPPLLIDFARRSKSYSSFFLSLGPDYSFHSHIIAKNDFIRSDVEWLAMGSSAPKELVFITENFMEDYFWCLDVGQLHAEYPVVRWRAGDRAVDPAHKYGNFHKFIVDQIEYYEQRSRHGA